MLQIVALAYCGYWLCKLRTVQFGKLLRHGMAAIDETIMYYVVGIYYAGLYKQILSKCLKVLMVTF